VCVRPEAIPKHYIDTYKPYRRNNWDNQDAGGLDLSLHHDQYGKSSGSRRGAPWRCLLAIKCSNGRHRNSFSTVAPYFSVARTCPRGRTFEHGKAQADRHHDPTSTCGRHGWPSGRLSNESCSDPKTVGLGREPRARRNLCADKNDRRILEKPAAAIRAGSAACEVLCHDRALVPTLSVAIKAPIVSIKSMPCVLR
jgi:hypothetical protein